MDYLILKHPTLDPMTFCAITDVSSHRKLDPIGVAPLLASATFDLYRDGLEKQRRYSLNVPHFERFDETINQFR
jgi:hypothetical protein